MRHSLLPSLFLAGTLAAAGPAAPAFAADSASGKDPSAEDLAREGVDKLMEALELLLESVPQYGLPEMRENGDIVIPRLNPDADENKGEAEPAIEEAI